MEIFDLKSRSEAAQLGMKLQRKHFIEHISKGDHSFGDNKHYFRLYSLNTPRILNSLRVWTQQSNDVSISNDLFKEPSHVENGLTLFKNDNLGTNQRDLSLIQTVGQFRVTSYHSRRAC